MLLKYHPIRIRSIFISTTPLEAAARADEPGTPENRIFTALSKLETVRASQPAFACDAKAVTIDTGHRSLLGVLRYLDGELLLGLFNFGDDPAVASAIHSDGTYLDLMTGEERGISEIVVPGQGFYWFKRMK